MEKLETEFAQIVKEQKDTIYTVCYMFSKDAEEINDLFQEILVNLWKGFLLSAVKVTSKRGCGK